MNTMAVVLEKPEQIRVSRLALSVPAPEDVVVDVEWSGISTGTERLLWKGTMPAFPGMGYPLIPGYESVGRVTRAPDDGSLRVGQTVFVPGARCYGDIRGVFGGSASRVVTPAARVMPVDVSLGERSVLMALAATAYHAVAGGGKRDGIRVPDLIVGHGVLGRLLARMTVAAGCAPPTVWETQAVRSQGGEGYPVLHPKDDDRHDYQCIYDVSGDPTLLNGLIARLAHGGEVVLAGFYTEPLKFDFAPAFMREVQIRTAAEWQRPDLLAVRQLVETGVLSLDGLITHHDRATHANAAYQTAFGDAGCLKMILDWSNCS